MSFLDLLPPPYLRMSCSLSPNSPDLHDLMLDFQSSLDHLGEQILTLEAAQAHISTISIMPAPPQPLPSASTKGKVHAQAASGPSKAKLAKKECSTKKAAIPSEGLSLHLAQTFPQEGKPNLHLMTVTILDATAAHAVGQGGKGLK